LWDFTDLIDRRFQAGFYSRFSRVVLIAVLLLFPALVVGSIRAVRSNNNQVEDWLPASFHETRQLQWFREHFAADQFVIISWPGCRLGDPAAEGSQAVDDPRIEKLAKALVPDAVDEDIFLGPKKSTTTGKYFKSVTTGRRVLDALLAAPASVPYKEAIARLQGALIGSDGRQTCVVVTLSREATQNLREVVGRGHPGGPIRRPRPPGELFEIIAQSGIDTNEVRVGGPPIDNVSIDEEGEKTLIKLAGMSLLFGLGLAWFSLRSVRLTSVVFANGVLSAMLAMSVVWYSGNKMDAVLMSMPLLVYVLAVSGAVHVVNYYRESLRDGESANASDRAIHLAWKPALLCSITTAVGLGSLCTSDLEPVRKFGLFSALGVGSLLLMTFVFLPSALQLFDKRPDNAGPARAGSKKKRNKNAQAAGPADWSVVKPLADDAWTHRHEKTRIERIWSWCAILLVRRYKLVSAVSIGLLVFAALGLNRVGTSIDLLKLFEPQARIIQDYTWFERNIGPLVPLEIVVRFPAPVQQEIESAPQRFVLDDVQLASSDELVADKEFERTRSPLLLNFLERCEIVDLCQRMIERKHGAGGKDLVGRSMSPVTFASELPDIGFDVGTQALRSGTNDVLWKHRDGFVTTGFLQIDPTDQSELWRISMRVRAFAGVDFGAFLHETQATIRPVLLAHQMRNRVLSEIKINQSADDHSSIPDATIWYHSPDGKTESVPEMQQFYLYSLKQFLNREGIKVKVRDVATSGDSSGGDTSIQILAGEANAEQRQAIQSGGGHFFDVPLDQQVGTEVAFDSDSPNTSDPLVQDTISAVYTGVVPIVYKSQRKLLEGLISSTVWSFLTITPLMMFVCRNIWAGLVVMIPNTLPVLVIFGGMGWLGAKVDIGSMMAASIALGVAVDDTIHFLTWFRQSLGVTRGRRRAIIMSYRHCASPTMQSALISGLGMSVFTLSSFTPTQRLGYLMVTILVAGVIAELFMLPAILAGPLGRVFHIKPANQPKAEADAVDSMPAEPPPPKMLSRRKRSVAS
jgi:predicted RND superfamily exporter protein